MSSEPPIDIAFLEQTFAVTERYEKLWGRWSADSQLLHIVTEISEVKDVLRNKNGKYGEPGSQEYLDALGDEVADVVLTALATAGIFGMSALQLNKYIKRKLAIVETRVMEAELEEQNANRT